MAQHSVTEGPRSEIRPHDSPAITAATGSAGPGRARVLVSAMKPGRCAPQGPCPRSFSQGKNSGGGQPSSPGPFNLWILRGVVVRRREVVSRRGSEKTSRLYLWMNGHVCAHGCGFQGPAFCCKTLASQRLQNLPDADHVHRKRDKLCAQNGEISRRARRRGDTEKAMGRVN